MSNFLFAIEATLPVFLIILLGGFLKKIRIINEGFCKQADQYVFKCALPLSLFRSVSTMDIYTDFSLSFCLFCFAVTTVMFLGVWAITWAAMKDRTMVGAFSQASVRSSAAVLGLALATNIYGSPGMTPMMILSAVPLFNIYAVVILSFSPQVDDEGRLIPSSGESGAVKKAIINVIKNPLIWGILIGVPFALLQLELPAILSSAVKSVGATATPVALISLGASFSAGEALKKWKPAAVATLIKLFILPLVFLPIAALLGFRGSSMVAILVMVGSPTTVSCYVMCRNMNGDGVLTSNTVMLATIFSSVSLTLWIFLLRAYGLI